MQFHELACSSMNLHSVPWDHITKTHCHSPSPYLSTTSWKSIPQLCPFFHRSHLLCQVPSPDTVPEALSYGRVMLGHHLVDQGTFGLDDCGKVCNGEHTDTMPPDSPAPSLPFCKAVFGDRDQVLGHCPAAIDLGQGVKSHPSQGGHHMFIRNFSELGPICKQKYCKGICN